MRSATAVVVRLGDLVDVVARVLRETPARTRASLASRRSRVSAVGTGAAVLVLYLWAIGDIQVSLGGSHTAFARAPSAHLLGNWPEKLVTTRGAFLFEPIAALYPLPQLALFLSPGNVVLGGVLAMLFGLNVAVAVQAVSEATTCRRTAYGRLASVLPAFLTGMICCVPSFVLLFGASTAALLLPALAPLRGYLFPLSLVLMTLTLLWATRRSETLPRRERHLDHGRTRAP
jgi:hypothetical protein